jgi:putative cardiolipin synthase
MLAFIGSFSKRNTILALLLSFVSCLSFALTCEQVVQKQKALMSKEIQEARIEFKAIANPQVALTVIVKMIREAEVSLDFSTFIIKPDEAGRIIISELLKAAQRGVKIRMIVDSYGSFKTIRSDLKLLYKHPNVELTSFNSLTNWIRYPKTFLGWLLDTFGFSTADRSTDKLFHNRLHDKIIVSDRGLANMLVMIGGRNAGEEYFGIGKSKNLRNAFLDLNVLIRPKDPQSEFSQDLNNYFESLFYHQTNQLLVQSRFNFFNSDAKTQRKILEAIENNRWLEEAIEALNQEHYFNDNFENASLKMVHELQNITQRKNLFDFKTLSWRSKTNNNSVLRSLRDAFRGAKNRIRIMTPYLILSDRDIQLIEKNLLLNSNLEIELFTNSIKTTNHASSQLVLEVALLPRIKQLMENPIIGNRLKVWMYYPKHSSDPSLPQFENTLHTKLVEIDGDYLITSSNFDLISRFSNSEMGFWLKPDAPIRDLQNYFARVEKNSIQFGSPEWQQSEINPLNQSWQSLKRYLTGFIQKFHISILKVF